MALFTQLQTSFGQLVNNTSVDSIERNFWLNEGYKKFVIAHDWPWAITIYGTPLVAYRANYPLPSDWRKWRWLKQDGVAIEEIPVELLIGGTAGYSILEDDSNLLINPVPTAASESDTTDNAESAGSAVVVEMSDTGNIAAGDFIYIEGISGGATVKEIASVSAVSANVSITISRLKHSYNAGAIVFEITEGLLGEYWYIPADMVGASDTNIVPDRWDMSIAKYAASMYYRKLEEHSLADRWLREFNTDIALCWKEQQLRSAKGRVEFAVKK